MAQDPTNYNKIITNKLFVEQYNKINVRDVSTFLGFMETFVTFCNDGAMASTGPHMGPSRDKSVVLILLVWIGYFY